ncbi:hypothetical protein JCM24511_00429 [Saitozyma sp. JCM 24511]|nr:hypothetical protein JCM24511_00429 [Saitozyma sp. JCM 24511]
MPYISTEALIGGALLIVLALGYQYLPQTTSSSSTSKSKKKNKKKTKTPIEQELGKAGPTSTGGGAKKGKKGKQTSAGIPNGNGAREQDSRDTSQPPSAPSQPETLGTKQAAQSPSFAAVASASSQTAKPKTLAERIAPKPRKTKVDDMLAPEDRPATHARVMKIASPSGEALPSPMPAPAPPAVAPAPLPKNESAEKVSKFEEDYAESSDEGTSATGTVEDDGWDMVPNRKKKPLSLNLSSAQGRAQSSTSPLPVESKIQRKNAKRAEAKRESKAAEEAERQRRLAMHRRDLERERINDLYAKKSSGAARSKGLGGGSKATLDTNGKLIWE